jgi:hypothetical protein
LENLRKKETFGKPQRARLVGLLVASACGHREADLAVVAGLVAAAIAAPTVAEPAAVAPVVVEVAGLGGVQQRVGGALVAWLATVFVRLCAFGIMVVPLATVVRWLLDGAMVARLMMPAILAAR